MGTNKVLILCGIFLVCLAVAVLLTGGVRTDVSLKEYNLFTETNEMILKIKTDSTLRYVGKAKIKKDGNDLYLKFYSAYGFNSNLAKEKYVVDISDIDEIYFYIGKKGYKKVLEFRNKEWSKPYNEIIVNKQI